MSDLPRAATELARRLRERVSITEGVIVVDDSLPGFASVSVFPASITWAVTCGMVGLSVKFGADAGESDNGVEVPLTSVSFSQDQCMRLAPIIAKVVIAVTHGN